MRTQALKWLGLLIALAAAWWLGWESRGDKLEWQQTQNELSAARRALDDFITESQRLQGLGALVEERIVKLKGNTETRIVEYRTHEKLVPLPADCRIDPERLRQLQAGVNDANAAIAAAESAIQAQSNAGASQQ
ncbi:hypothetical protein [Chromobacterium haemolyticum]|uniref:hypothetical protein n=1 Tax=Chromobacterium haemolyticum TaxID=394935 RepID=UPI001318B5F0|nr:hypothetical protein [Chromobacterium haemolyticum]BBH12933.1 hypothetical protein CH06BL_21810 [Chromobacterium haemolyticum]